MKDMVYVLRQSETRCLINGWMQHSQLKMNPFAGRGSTTSAVWNENFDSVVSILEKMIAILDGRELVLIFQYSQALDS
jgi:hypothetical protein